MGEKATKKQAKPTPPSNPYKSITLQPLYYIDDTTGEILDPEPLEATLHNDITTLAQLAEWQIHSDETLLEDLENYLEQNDKTKNSVIGARLKITIPALIKQHMPSTGRSRYERIFQDRIISEAKSWLARAQAASGTNKNYVSAGWKRTANNTRPSNLKPKISTSAADVQYAEILNDPLSEGLIDMHLVIGGKWYILRFALPRLSRFKQAKKICLPNIRENEEGEIVFDFAFEFTYQYSLFSSRYVVGVDVGVTRYATYCVVDTLTNEIVEQGTLSRRAHSLENSIHATAKQVRALKILGRDEEAVPHRTKNKHKRKELAILGAQEIAAVSARFDNAVVGFEDLGHIEDTMRFGRWNRGALVEWSRHFVELNGGRVFTVNPAYSSQNCSSCGVRGSFVEYRTFVCGACGLRLDRDVNAAANVALFFVRAGSWGKAVASRRSAKNATSRFVRRSAAVHDSLKYPGRDRTKNKPTPGQPRQGKKTSSAGEVNDQSVMIACSGVGRIPQFERSTGWSEPLLAQDSRKAARCFLAMAPFGDTT